MQQTPAHEQHNPELLSLIPERSGYLVEIGCSSGALAREFKKKNAAVHYVGVDISAEYIEQAKRYCDEHVVLDMDVAEDSFFDQHGQADCWVFGDTLEHLKDPWTLLARIRQRLPKHGVLVACIPNMQHWSIQARLACGDLRYEDQGLLDRTHLRWFTRQTIIELFVSTGYEIDAGIPRVFNQPEAAPILEQIRHMAKVLGVQEDMAVQDALPLQYVIRAKPGQA